MPPLSTEGHTLNDIVHLLHSNPAKTASNAGLILSSSVSFTNLKMWSCPLGLRLWPNSVALTLDLSHKLPTELSEIQVPRPHTLPEILIPLACVRFVLSSVSFSTASADDDKAWEPLMPSSFLLKKQSLSFPHYYRHAIEISMPASRTSPKGSPKLPLQLQQITFIWTAIQ